MWCLAVSRNAALAVLGVCSVVSLVIATGAVPFSTGDYVHEQIVLSPADGPNGVYAVQSGGGEVELLLTNANPAIDGSGVPDEALTPLDRVLTVAYTGKTHAYVWFSDDANSITFFRGENVEETVEGRANGITLAPNQTVAIGILVDTRGDHDVSRVSSFTVNAELIDSESGADGDATTGRPTETPPKPDTGPGSTGGGGGGSSAGAGGGGGAAGDVGGAGSGGMASDGAGSASGSSTPSTETTSAPTQTPTVNETSPVPPSTTATVTGTQTDKEPTVPPTTGPVGTPTETELSTPATGDDTPTPTTSSGGLEAIEGGAEDEAGPLSEFPIGISGLRWLLPLFFLAGTAVLVVLLHRTNE